MKAKVDEVKTTMEFSLDELYLIVRGLDAACLNGAKVYESYAELARTVKLNEQIKVHAKFVIKEQEKKEEQP